MPFRRIVRRLSRRPASASPGLRPAAEVARLLAVERARADRTGQCFAVVAFTPRGPEFVAPTVALLGELLPTRLRATDAAGWLDGERVCAVLPYTPAAGAWTLADDVCVRFPEHVPPPICTVYTYPTGNVPAAGGDPLPPLTPPPADGAGGRRPPRRTTAPLQPLLARGPSAGKRALDVTGAALGLLALLPLLPVVALAIKADSRGPVFFGQRRAGLGGQAFRMWKFRTMVADAEARKADLAALNEQDGPAFKIRHDPRVTRVGRLLRKTSVDELPQLWNVLRGEMSLVGPRPLPTAEAAKCEGWHHRRLDVLPGLTCIWQVEGRSAVTFVEWMRMDARYIDGQSVGKDLELIARTVPAMLRPKGAC